MTGFLWGCGKALSLRLCGGFRVCGKIWGRIWGDLGNNEVKFILSVSILSLYLNKGMLQDNKSVSFRGR